MMESPVSMAHASSSYACAEDVAHSSSSYACAVDGYFIRPDTMSIDGDIRSDSGLFFVGFGVGGCLARD